MKITESNIALAESKKWKYSEEFLHYGENFYNDQYKIIYFSKKENCWVKADISYLAFETPPTKVKNKVFSTNIEYLF